MKYKTTIEVTTEADNAYEAADIAGELLRGDVNAKADLKVKTSTLARSRVVKSFIILCISGLVLGCALIGTHYYTRIAEVERRPVTSYAIQPSLKTNSADVKNNSEFKKMWDKEQTDRIDSNSR